jgi:hypothetical protein
MWSYLNVKIGRWYFSLLVVVLCHGYLPVFAQGEWNNWYFGNHTGLSFNGGQPVPLLNSQLWPSGRCPIVISDSLGNLLFYSNGNQLWNRNHNVTPNGSNLFGGVNGTQPVFAIKSISNKNQYFLFTVGDNGWYTGGLCYSIIDMTLNGGYGDIIPGFKNILVASGVNARNTLTATRHKNNKDAWIITCMWENGYKYMSYCLTSSGLDTMPVISTSLINKHTTDQIDLFWRKDQYFTYFQCFWNYV